MEHKESLLMYTRVPDTQELKHLCVRDEDLLLNKDPSNVMYGRGITRISEPIDYYATGTMRRIEEYGDLGLLKIKANWYVKQKYALCP
jgi:hypothetical protein